MIILDTNILISALIRNSLTRKILVESSLRFGYPETSFLEIEKHRGYIIKKSGIQEAELEKILNKLKEYVYLISQDIIQPRLGQAVSVMKSIDISDSFFLAAALALKAPVWSDDRGFERQSLVKIVKTE